MVAEIGTTVQTGIVESSHAQCMGCRVTEWMGRGIALIEAGSGKLSPYFQNRWIAAISLMGMSALLMHYAFAFAEWAGKRYVVRRSNNGMDTVMVFSVCAGGTFMGGVVAFSKFTHLPFGKLAQTIMVVAGACIYAFLTESLKNR